MEIDQTPLSGTEQEPITPQANPVTEPGTQAAPAAPVEPQQPAIDYAEKFKHSSREAQILKARAEMLESRVNQLTAPDAPNEAELRSTFPEWDGYDAFTKGVLTRQLATEKRAARTEALLIEQLAEQKWQEDLKNLARNPKYQSLRDDPQFEAFVLKPGHKGLAIETLARAYLFQEPDDRPTTPPTPAPQSTDTPELEMGQGGPRTTEKPKLSAEEAQVIMTTNPKRYREMLISGEIVLE